MNKGYIQRNVQETASDNIMVVSMAIYLRKQNQLFDNEMCTMLKYRIKGNDL